MTELPIFLWLVGGFVAAFGLALKANGNNAGFPYGDQRFFGPLTDEIAATGGWPIPTAELNVP